MFNPLFLQASELPGMERRPGALKPAGTEGRTQQSIDIVRWRRKAASVEGRRCHRSQPGAWPHHAGASKMGRTWLEFSGEKSSKIFERSIQIRPGPRCLGRKPGCPWPSGSDHRPDTTLAGPRQPSSMWLWFEAQEPDGLFVFCVYIYI